MIIYKLVIAIIFIKIITYAYDKDHVLLERKVWVIAAKVGLFIYLVGEYDYSLWEQNFFIKPRQETERMSNLAQGFRVGTRETFAALCCFVS